MMFVHYILLTSVPLVYSQAFSGTQQLNPFTAAMTNEMTHQCLEETDGAEQQDLIKLLNYTAPAENDQRSSCLLSCLYRKTGAQNEDGTFADWMLQEDARFSTCIDQVKQPANACASSRTFYVCAVVIATKFTLSNIFTNAVGTYCIKNLSIGTNYALTKLINFEVPDVSDRDATCLLSCIYQALGDNGQRTDGTFAPQDDPITGPCIELVAEPADPCDSALKFFRCSVENYKQANFPQLVAD